MKSEKQIQYIRVKIVGSKKCENSLSAQKICEENNLKFDWIDSDQNSEMRKVAQQCTQVQYIPLIFINEEFLGGFQDLQTYIKQNFNEDETLLRVNRNYLENLPIVSDQRTENQQNEQHKIISQLTQTNIKLYQIALRQKIKPVQQGVFDKDIKEKKLAQKELINEQEDWFGKKYVKKFPDSSFVVYYDNIEILERAKRQLQQEERLHENNIGLFPGDYKKIFQVNRLNNNNMDSSVDLDIQQKKQSKLAKTQMLDYDFKIPVVAISGFPVYIHEWKKLQLNLGENCVRIIHFIIPGFDKIDERRGSQYSGDTQDICKLLKNLLNHLNIDKIILMAHSFGQFIAAKFRSLYSHVVCGQIYMGTDGPIPQSYLQRYYLYMLKQFNTSHKNLPQHSENIIKECNKNIIRNEFKEYGNQQFPNLTLIELIAFIKILLSYRNGLEGCYQEVKNLGKQVKLIVNGENDELQSKKKAVTGGIFEQVFGNSRYPGILTQQQKDYFLAKIKQKFENFDENNFNFANLQSNFVLYLQETGHSVHKQRSEELINPMLVYMSLIEAMEIQPNQKL